MPERRSAQVLLTAGRLFLRELGPVTAKFVAHGLPETFVTELTTLVNSYEQLIRDRETGKGESAAARASIEAAIGSGVAAARKLDVIVSNLLRDDVIALAEWERDRQVDRLRGRRASDTSDRVPSADPSGVPDVSAV
jgi:hypothetical protein